MKRIDSINARPNMNGTGKAGFSDNTDLIAHDATYLTPDYLNHLQEELCNILEKNGIVLNASQRDQLYQLLATNADIDALAAATQIKLDQEQTWRTDADNWLQQQIDNLQQQIYSAQTRITLLEDHELYRVGDLFISTTLFVHAGEVHAHIGYGTWQRFGDGHALVAAAFLNENGAPAFMLTPGATGGEYSHVLTIDEMPAHSHKLGDSAGTSGTGRTPDLNSSPPDTMNTTDAIGTTGGGMAHNNIQPSITVCVWKRIS